MVTLIKFPKFLKIPALALALIVTAPDYDPETLQMLRHNELVLQCRNKQIESESRRRGRHLTREEMIRTAQTARCPKFIVIEEKPNVRNAR